MKGSRSEYLVVNDVRYHIRRWGDPEAPMLILLHGWMDMSATFQFMVDAFQDDWNVIAPDWAGFGASGWSPSGYSFTHYLTDLDRLLEHYTPDAPARIVAHSMGANITNMYAAARPERLSHFVNIEGYAPIPEFFKGSLGNVIGRWLEHLRDPSEVRTYADYAQLTRRLMKGNRRLDQARAEYLASQLGHVNERGELIVAADPKARFISPISLHREQSISLWSEIEARVLCIRGENSFVTRAFDKYPGELALRVKALRDGREVVLHDASHNLHHEVPEELARLVESFLAELSNR
jgi:pimeloyl-ACP methyl ester carboxylesterase